MTSRQRGLLLTALWACLASTAVPAEPKGYSAKGYCDTAHTLAMARRA